MAITKADLDTPHHLQEVADVLAGARKIVVITGAGISTNCGIPVSIVKKWELNKADLVLQDFRSKDGLYSLIQSHHEKLHGPSASAASIRMKGRELFDSAIWRNEQSTSTFYTFIATLRKKIRTAVDGATITHKFIRQLRDQRKLVRCYTQNIDGLESREGLNTDLSRGKGVRTRFTKKAVTCPYSSANILPGNVLDGGCEVVQMHGDLDLLRCTMCSEKCAWDDQNGEAVLMNGEAPSCPKCSEKNKARADRGMRSTTIGTLRPNIVLYGEQHPSSDDLGAIIENDLKLGPEVVLILGTSLKVNGLQVMVKEFAKAIHAKAGKKRKVIFVNRTKPPGGIWKDVIDYHISMDCDQWVQDALVRRSDLGQTQSGLAEKLVQGRRLPSVPAMPETLSSAHTGRKLESVTQQSADQERLGGLVLSSPARSRSPVAYCKGRVKVNTADVSATILKTPSKPRQLPTPPSSRDHRQLTSDILIDPMADRDSDMPVPGPAKRRKTDVKIWEDESSASIHLLTPSKDDSQWKLVPKNAAAVNRLQSWRNSSTISAPAVLGNQTVVAERSGTYSHAIEVINSENHSSCEFHFSKGPSKEVSPATLAMSHAFIKGAKPPELPTAQSLVSETGRKRRRI
ncbi:hypothetical protein MMC18_002511 [Xylographa bjoerkii]|nr:hypothetical protein [Xylographa bjoerkii]